MFVPIWPQIGDTAPRQASPRGEIGRAGYGQTMSETPMTDEETRVLMAVAAAGTAGTGTEPLAVRTGLEKVVILDHLSRFWDQGLVEQMEGIRGLYRITDAGRGRLR